MGSDWVPGVGTAHGVTAGRLRARWQRADPERTRLFSTFGYLLGTQGATSLLGLAYWPLSTHFFSARAVGLAAAATSTATFLASIGVLGVATLLLAEIRAVDEADRHALVSTGLLVAGIVVVVLSVGTMLLSPVLGHSLRAIGRNPLLSALFVVGAVATVTTLIFDNAAIGLRRGRVRLGRAVLASVLKLAIVGALILAGSTSSTGLVFAWSCGLVVALALVFRMLRLPRDHSRAAMSERASLTRQYAKLSLNHHVLNLSMNSVSFILPVVATLLVTPTAVAYFSTAQVVSSTVGFLPYMLAFALFAETANDEQLLRRLIRRTLPLGLATCAAIVAGVEIGAPFMLRFFGTAYSTHGSTALRLLIIGCLPYVVKDHYVAICRAQRRLATGARVLAAATAVECTAGAIGGALWGLKGLCAGWAVAAGGEAVVLLPTVVRAYRRPTVVEPTP